MSDFISRAAAIDAIINHFGFANEEEYGSAVQEVLNNLPSEQPERKNGKWIDSGSGWKCSCCGSQNDWAVYLKLYCPDCTADMRGDTDADSD